MEKIMTISCLTRTGQYEDRSVPKLIIANRHLKNLSGLNSGDRISVNYLSGSIIITKLQK